MKIFLKKIGIGIGLFICVAIVAAISPLAAVAMGLVLLIVPGIAVFKPIPALGLGHRAFSFYIAFFVGFLGAVTSLGVLSNEMKAATAAQEEAQAAQARAEAAQAEAAKAQAEMAALKEANPIAYLDALKKIDEDLWFKELVVMDPARHAAEVERVKAEKAEREEAERAAAAAEAQRQAVAAAAQAERQAVAAAERERRRQEAEAERLANYTGLWRIGSSTSDIDDSTNVHLSLDADNTIDGLFGRAETPVLRLACRENKTMAYIAWKVFLSTDSIRMLTRIDRQKAVTRTWRISTDYEAAGKWDGSSIPFIKSLFGKSQILARITPHGERPVTATFTVVGLDNAIKSLRKECGW